ncbi:N-acetyltransferase, partial [Clostridium perfringens]
NGLTIRGVSYDMVIHTATKENWPMIQQRLEKPAILAERLLRENPEE